MNSQMKFLFEIKIIKSEVQSEEFLGSIKSIESNVEKSCEMCRKICENGEERCENKELAKINGSL